MLKLNVWALTPPAILDENLCVSCGQRGKLVSFYLAGLCIFDFFLNGEVVSSCSAARSAGFAESAFVLLTEPSIRAQQQPVWAAILDLRAADLPAPRAVAVTVGQVSALLDLIGTCLLPPVRVAAHLEEVDLLHGGSHFVLLCCHVL